MKKKIFCFLICLALVFTVSMPAMAEIITGSKLQLIHISIGKSYDTQTTVFYADLEGALKDAVSGDIIELYGDVTISAPIVIPDGTELTFVSGTKRTHNTILGRSAFEYTDQNAVTRTIKKDFDGSLFTLGENSRVTFENIVLDGNGKGGENGGLIYAKSGAATFIRRGVTLKNSVLDESSEGGAIYAEKNAGVTVENTVFSGNDATRGKDIYAVWKSSVNKGAGVTADLAYTEDGVCTSGINLVVSSKIALNFHTYVADNYLGGTFVLTSGAGAPVLYKISECAKDAEGRFTAKYFVEPEDFSETVTLTVYDAGGNLLTAKRYSVEAYKNAIAIGNYEKSVRTFIANIGTALAGDVNGDGRVNVSDCVYIKLIISGDKAANAAADINHDGTVNAADAKALAEYIVEISDLPEYTAPII